MFGQISGSRRKEKEEFNFRDAEVEIRKI